MNPSLLLHLRSRVPPSLAKLRNGKENGLPPAGAQLAPSRFPRRLLRDGCIEPTSSLTKGFKLESNEITAEPLLDTFVSSCPLCFVVPRNFVDCSQRNTNEERRTTSTTITTTTIKTDLFSFITIHVSVISRPKAYLTLAETHGDPSNSLESRR